MKKENNFINKLKSPIPPHLTPEEREQWEKDAEWERQERQRRKREGMYSGRRSDGFVSRIFKKLAPNDKKDGNIGYGP